METFMHAVALDGSMIAADKLERLELFHGSSLSAIAALAAIAVECTYATDELLFRATDRPRGWYVVLSGSVRVVRGDSGRQHVVHREIAGGTLGEVPLFAGGTHPATGIAAEATTCALFPGPALERILGQHPEVAKILLARLARRVAALVNRLDERSARSVQSRLAEFLLSRLDAAGSDRISVGMTQQQLAEELGTVREVASRELQSLASAGLIARRGGGRWTILDADGLRRLAS